MSTGTLDASEHVLYPKPLGLVRANETALFIASPLLSAGAISLIGVVCADSSEFLWAGPALLLLVFAVILLLLSIQLGYHARQWIYSYEDLQNWTAQSDPPLQALERQAEDYKKGRKKLLRAGMVYNAGTVFLAFGIASALVPDGTDALGVWRLVATGFVATAAVGETVWTVGTYFPPSTWPWRRRDISAREPLLEVEHNDA
ncbi:hypothetical protein [Streptomyces sp. NPDC057257]|uniref:hypothetical protein n=1 Tax=Streptomyces sp. NPDC057257 TaxID=3346071 RepID=UPI00362B6538